MDVTDAVAGNRQRVVGFADVVRIPLRRWRLVLTAAAAVLLAVLAYLFVLPATYRATTVVVLRPVVTDPFTLPAGGADRAVNMTAENGVALGNEVIDATASALGREPDEVRTALAVEVPTGGQVLRFEYSDSTEGAAVTGANAAAQTYLQVREGIYQQQRESLLLSYDATTRQVTEQRQEAQRGLPDTGRLQNIPPRTQAMLDQVNALNDQIAQLANQRAKIASADLSPGAVTAAARAPVPSSNDAWPLFLLGGLLGGLLIGMMLAHARETLDRRVRSVDQAADIVGLPALGVVRSAGRHSEAAAAADARYVSLAVLKWFDQHPDQALVVLSGRDDEGRAVVSGNLAVALAEAGRDVWLAGVPERHDDLRKVLFAAQSRIPARPRKLSEGDAPTETLNGDPEATLIMRAPGAGVVTAPPAPAPAKSPLDDRRSLKVLIGSGSIQLVSLGEEPKRGVVVVDAPPSDVDERGVRAAQDGVAVLVVARDRTRQRELVRLVDRLRSAGARTAGFVLTGGQGA